MEAEHFQFGQTSSMEYEILSDFQTVASISIDGAAIQLRKIITGTERRIVSTHERGVCSMAFSTEDSQTLATEAFDGTVKLWDIETGVENGDVEETNLQFPSIGAFSLSSAAPFLQVPGHGQRGFETRQLGSPDEI
jgi:WD40 repeat protein